MGESFYEEKLGRTHSSPSVAFTSSLVSSMQSDKVQGQQVQGTYIGAVAAKVILFFSVATIGLLI
jgi:hypothetical protein